MAGYQVIKKYIYESRMRKSDDQMTQPYQKRRHVLFNHTPKDVQDWNLNWENTFHIFLSSQDKLFYTDKLMQFYVWASPKSAPTKSTLSRNIIQ